ncbi:STM3941 family protein [Mycobacterium sp. SMC-11]|uniref:STM3941 family protein n=1 Tax=Mycobacterium sp. SMC-11 TaxID=3385969 RepID=UPI00390C464D
MPFEAHPDRRKIASLLAIAVVFVLIGVRLAGGFGPVESIRGWSPQALHVFGWIAIVFFGFGVAVLVSRLFSSGVEVRIDAEGVYGRRSGNRVIPWNAIERITTADTGRVQLAHLFLDDASAIPSPKRLGAKSFGHVTLSLQGTDGKLSDMRAAFDYFAPGRRDDSAG